MKIKNYIPVQQLCTSYEVELSFFGHLHELGLIEVITVEKTKYVHQENLINLEKIIRLHHELEVNMEGIDIVMNLLQRIENLQTELKSAKNRLSLFEKDDLNKPL